MAKHVYQLYEVGADGEEHPTGKSITCAFPNDRNDQIAIVGELIKLYGFNDYASYYYMRPSTKDKIVFYYNYFEGAKDTWVLKRGK